MIDSKTDRNIPTNLLTDQQLLIYNLNEILNIPTDNKTLKD
jgi:hypothetical protein